MMSTSLKAACSTMKLRRWMPFARSIRTASVLMRSPTMFTSCGRLPMPSICTLQSWLHCGGIGCFGSGSGRVSPITAIRFFEFGHLIA
jgi:hypothetical protein